MRTLFAVTCALCLLAMPALAETSYVSDQLVITVRAGKEAGSAIVATLRTDTPVEVLKKEGRHLRVRTGDGTEGYVQAQYITDETPKPIVIARLQAQLAKLQGSGEEVQALRADAAALAEARRELQSLEAKYDALLKESGDVLEVIEERDRLRDDQERLAAELETLRAENAQLLRQGGVRWFLAGAGVLLAGWLAGKVSRKKRRGFY